MLNRLKYFFVKKIYADHNDSKAVIDTLDRLVSQLPADGFGLNIGAGGTSFDSRIRNMEIADSDNIDYVGSVENIPLASESVDLVITQEVLEHVRDPFLAISEIERVLKPGGKLYIQLPFTIGFHPCPNDYWRFTHEGIDVLVKHSGMEILQSGMTVGPATGFYRILVEFVAILFSLPLPLLYKLIKGVAAVLFYPIKWLDIVLIFSPQKNRIAGGYYVVSQKVDRE
ncbi:MAG: class I SAM-dependent methyltransferase [Gammaproteobacteria bacterium]|nr:class I SAM-dependent methyltransferase [Gammaproteobacteria bacterium]